MGETIKFEWHSVSDLQPYEHNARKHEHEDVDAIKRSIVEFGFNDPIGIWSDENIIVEGHGRLIAAKELGMTEVPCIRLDHLSDGQRRAYALAHNKTAELSEWDFDELDLELAGITEIDMSAFGFDSPVEELEAVEDEFEAEIPAEPKTKPGDLYQLGNHRLICGDATDVDTIDRLMGGQRADLCFTSPPYNMGAGDFSSAPNKSMNGGHAYGGFDDNLNNDEYTELICGSLSNALAHCDDVLFNIGILQNSKFGIINMLDRFRDYFLDIVVWNKSQSMPFGMKNQKGMLSHRCELIFCFNQSGNRSFSHPQWEIGAGINRIDTCNASGNEYSAIHAATFPVEFAFECVKMFSDSSVLDLFGGTGTTMIACEELGRSCFMSELDPKYCDVIVERWEKLTGEKAVLINDEENMD